jgi:hypothetical protein
MDFLPGIAAGTTGCIIGLELFLISLFNFTQKAIKE